MDLDKGFFRLTFVLSIIAGFVSNILQLAHNVSKFLVLFRGFFVGFAIIWIIYFFIYFVVIKFIVKGFRDKKNS